MMKALRIRQQKRESETKNCMGSITVETILFLTMYIVFFVGLLDLVQMTHAQVLMQYAIDETAKEISYDSYILTKAGVIKQMQKTSKSGQDFKNKTTETLNNAKDLLSQIGGIASGDFPDMNAVSSDVDSIESYFSDTGTIKSGIIAVIKNAGKNMISDVVMEHVCKGTLRREIKEMANGRDPDSYLRSLGLTNGLDSIQVHASYANQDPAEIRISATFQVSYDLLFFKINAREYRVTAETGLW